MTDDAMKGGAMRTASSLVVAAACGLALTATARADGDLRGKAQASQSAASAAKASLDASKATARRLAEEAAQAPSGERARRLAEAIDATRKAIEDHAARAAGAKEAAAPIVGDVTAASLEGSLEQLREVIEDALRRIDQAGETIGKSTSPDEIKKAVQDAEKAARQARDAADARAAETAGALPAEAQAAFVGEHDERKGKREQALELLGQAAAKTRDAAGVDAARSAAQPGVARAREVVKLAGKAYASALDTGAIQAARAVRAADEARVLAGEATALLASEAVARIDSARRLAATECHEAYTICLSAEGEPFLADELPARIDPGTALSVKVIALDTELDALEDAITVDITPVRSRSQLFAAPPPVGHTKGAGDGAPAPQFAVLLAVSSRVPPDTDAQTVEISFLSTAGTGASKRYSIEVRQGRHYLQVGLLVPFVHQGDRRIATVDVPGSSLRQAVVARDTAITAALALTFYPWGRRNGLLSPFELGWGWRALGDAVGFQIAKDFDFTQARGDWYLGAVLQPIHGLVFSVGLSHRRAEFLADGVSSARLYGPDEAVPTAERYIRRPYVGVMFTQDVLDGVKRALAGLRTLRDDE